MDSCHKNGLTMSRSEDVIVVRVKQMERFRRVGSRSWMNVLLMFCAGAVQSPLAAAGDGKPGPAAGNVTRKEEAAVHVTKRVSPSIAIDAAAVESRLMTDVEYLASEELEGRGPRSKGLDLAAEYIARAFDQAGLETTRLGGPYHEFRLFSTSRRGVVQSVEIGLKSAETLTPLSRGTDFTSLSSSSIGTFSFPVVFAGYGITAPALDYDDYAGIDVRGKAVLVLRHEPQQMQADSRFDGTENSSHAYIQAKIRNAKSHGAAALILCTTHAEQLRLASEKRDGKPGDAEPVNDPLLQADLNSGNLADGIPVIHVRRAHAEAWIRDTLSEELSSIETRIDQTLEPQSRELPDWKVNGTVQIVRSHRTFRNVVGCVEGSGPNAEQTIVVGAHYDHLGRESFGSLALDGEGEIHYGADDNASGTAVLMEVARQIAAHPQTLGRRVLFIAFTAEEMGLIGSKNYVQDPVIPLDQTVAMINLDMVGRLRGGKLTAYGVETSEDWRPMLTKSVESLPDGRELKLAFRSGGYGPSDHASFYEKGIPVLHFFTGFHAEYHRPSDVASLINQSGMRQISSLVKEMVVELANREAAPSRKPANSSANTLEGLMLGELDEPLDSGPRLGVHVEPESSGEGVVVRRVLAGSAADRNGLKVGDVITSINGHEVHSAAEIRKVLEKPETPKDWKVRLRRGEILTEITVQTAL